MSDADLRALSLAEVSTLLHRREVSATALTRAVLDGIEWLNGALNCFITVSWDEALRAAERLDQELARGQDRGALHGVPLTLKDNIMTAGIRTTAASPLLASWVPDADAEVVRRLKRAGAVLVGKTNLQQYAYGGTHEHYGEPRNPHDLDRTCGGSSSGSAAAVCARLGYGSVGTDTGGSIRVPAAYCGVVGLKPTFGLVSRSGVIPVSTNLDHVGPLARTAQDAALLLQAMVDPTQAGGAGYADRLGGSLRGIRMGLATPQADAPVDAEVAAAVREAMGALAAEGASVHDWTAPDLGLAQLLMSTISGAEASEYHLADLRRHPEAFSEPLRTRLESAQFIPAVDYVRAQRVRQALLAQVNAAFHQFDILALPGVAIPAFKRGMQRVSVGGREDLAAEVSARLTALFNLTGHPALVLPCRFTAEGLPIGLQLVAGRGREHVLLQVAHAYQQITRWHLQPPAATSVLDTTDGRAGRSEAGRASSISAGSGQ